MPENAYRRRRPGSPKGVSQPRQSPEIEAEGRGDVCPFCNEEILAGQMIRLYPYAPRAWGHSACVTPKLSRYGDS